MEVPLKSHLPKSYQSENWLLDPKHYWERIGRAAPGDLNGLADYPETLWLNGYSTSSGSNDRVRLADAEQLSSSLVLLHMDKLDVRVFAPGEYFGNPKRRVQVNFSHLGHNYGLWVTDPLVERKYLACEDGDYAIGECYITVSLGEPYEGYCYKLVAALITPELDIDQG